MAKRACGWCKREHGGAEDTFLSRLSERKYFFWRVFTSRKGREAHVTASGYNAVFAPIGAQAVVPVETVAVRLR